MIIHPTSAAGFGVYVHWPFCASKCPYCDFNSHVRHAPVDEARFAAAFAKEIAHQAMLAPGRTVGSIFFGGGTPSLMRPSTIENILESIAKHWSVAPDVEVTLEANPTSVEAERLKGYRAAGVNRVSLGVQSLRDDSLRSLGRLHSAQEALNAVKLAASLFERYSFDLIYARPGQSADVWAEELREALTYASGHLSLYQLTIEPETPFEALQRVGKLIVPQGDEARALYDTTQELCEAAGLPAYEVSNHAKPGQECRHNLLYWRYGEYAGVGPGAHGRLVVGGQRLALSTERHPETWLSKVEANGHGLIESEPLSREAQGDEFLLMGLRLAEGVDPKTYEALSGRTLDPDRIEYLTGHKLVVQSQSGHLRVTSEGFPVLDAVVADLAA